MANKPNGPPLTACTTAMQQQTPDKGPRPAGRRARFPVGILVAATSLAAAAAVAWLAFAPAEPPAAAIAPAGDAGRPAAFQPRARLDTPAREASPLTTAVAGGDVPGDDGELAGAAPSQADPAPGAGNAGWPAGDGRHMFLTIVGNETSVSYGDAPAEVRSTSPARGQGGAVPGNGASGGMLLAAMPAARGASVAATASAGGGASVAASRGSGSGSAGTAFPGPVTGTAGAGGNGGGQGAAGSADTATDESSAADFYSDPIINPDCPAYLPEGTSTRDVTALWRQYGCSYQAECPPEDQGNCAYRYLP